VAWLSTKAPKNSGRPTSQSPNLIPNDIASASNGAPLREPNAAEMENNEYNSAVSCFGTRDVRKERDDAPKPDSIIDTASAT
jgi:hypothetical protein